LGKYSFSSKKQKQKKYNQSPIEDVGETLDLDNFALQNDS